MSILDRQMGQLRSLLHAPNDESWEAICQRLETWYDVDHLFEVAIPYAIEHLANWPGDVSRAAPRRWVKVLCDADTKVSSELRRERLGLLALADRWYTGMYEPCKAGAAEWDDLPFALQAHTIAMEYWRTLDGALLWLSRQRAPHLRTLRLGSQRARTEILSLPGASWWAQLESLKLGGLAEILHQLFAIAPMPRLRELDLSGSSVSRELFCELFEVKKLQLDTLVLAECQLEPHEAEFLAAQPAIRSLSRLDIRYNMSLGDGVDYLLESEHLSEEARAQIHESYDDIFE